MENKKYKIGNTEFATEEEYRQADGDLKIIKAIKEKFNTDSPEHAKAILSKIHQNPQTFQSVYGKYFIKELEKVAAQGNMEKKEHIPAKEEISKNQEVKLCKFCKTEIPKQAKVCPNCRKKQSRGILKWVIIAVLVLGVIGAIAGGRKDNDNTEQVNNGYVEEVVEKEDNEKEGENENKEETEKQEDFKEIIAVNNEECSIKINGIEPDNFWGYTLNVELENKSSEKNYMFSVVTAAINGIQTDPLFATDVSAGKKSNSEINFSDSSLKEYGIEEFTDIEISFRVYDSDNWESDDVAKETVHVYPLGEENAVKFERESKDSDVTIADNSEVYATIIGFREDEIWGYTADIFLQNKTDKTVMFSVEDASVNGYMSDPFWATSVSGGKCAFSSMSWSSEMLEENGIEEVEEIEFVFDAYDEESMTNYFKEKVTFSTIELGDFFTESNYLDTNGQSRPCYLATNEERKCILQSKSAYAIMPIGKKL